MDKPCEREQGHFDGGSFAGGTMTAMALVLLIVALVDGCRDRSEDALSRARQHFQREAVATGHGRWDVSEDGQTVMFLWNDAPKPDARQ